MPQRGPKGTLGSDRGLPLRWWGLYTGRPGQGVPVPTDAQGPRPLRHDCRPRRGAMGRCWGTGAGMGGECTAARGREAARPPRAPGRRDPHRGPHRGAGIGAASHNHPKGEPGSALLDQHGAVCAPGPVAPGHAPALGLFPQGRRALHQGANEVGWALSGASRHLAGGCASPRNRQGLGPAGLLPTMPEPPGIGSPPSAGGSASAMPRSMRCGGGSGAPWRGRTQASDADSAANVYSRGMMACHCWPTH
jgi:hypothetical protein